MSNSNDAGTEREANIANLAARTEDAGEADRILAASRRELRSLLADPLPPGLYVVSTPIGHLGDMTLRAIATLAAADVIYCEDTRHSRTLMERFAIKRPLRPYHEHNAEALRPVILEKLQAGQRIALISDAGTPLVSDPGFKLVRDAASAGVMVTSAPGASAALTSLTSSGLPSDSFLFAGFLPSKKAQRLKRLDQLKSSEATLILFEAPTRLPEALEDALAILGNRQAAVGRELTKRHEDVSRGSLQELAAKFANTKVKGECVLLVSGCRNADLSDQEIEVQLASLLETRSVKDASKLLADDLKIAKGRIYDLALRLKKKTNTR